MGKPYSEDTEKITGEGCWNWTIQQFAMDLRLVDMNAHLLMFTKASLFELIPKSKCALKGGLTDL